MFVKVGDKVRVISGKDKGKEGTIKQKFVFLKKLAKVSTSNLNGGRKINSWQIV